MRIGRLDWTGINRFLNGVGGVKISHFFINLTDDRTEAFFMSWVRDAWVEGCVKVVYLGGLTEVTERRSSKAGNPCGAGGPLGPKDGIPLLFFDRLSHSSKDGIAWSARLFTTRMVLRIWQGLLCVFPSSLRTTKTPNGESGVPVSDGGSFPNSARRKSLVSSTREKICRFAVRLSKKVSLWKMKEGQPFSSERKRGKS